MSASDFIEPQNFEIEVGIVQLHLACPSDLPPTHSNPRRGSGRTLRFLHLFQNGQTDKMGPPLTSNHLVGNVFASRWVFFSLSVTIKHLSRRTSAYPGSTVVCAHRAVCADARRAKMCWLASFSGCQFAPYSLTQAARRPYQRHRRACTSSSRPEGVRYIIVPRAGVQLLSQTKTLHSAVRPIVT
jgi:hypothetical protein